MDKQELIELIHKAFDGVSRLGGVSLNETVVIDNYGTDEERAEARKKDQDGRWQNVPYEDLARVCGIGGISFLDVIGWRYYLPAYMTWYLDDVLADESLASSSLIWSLKTANNGPDQFEYDRFNSLNDDQKKAVRVFLEYVAQLETPEGHLGDTADARKALESYWNQY